MDGKQLDKKIDKRVYKMSCGKIDRKSERKRAMKWIEM